MFYTPILHYDGFENFKTSIEIKIRYWLKPNIISPLSNLGVNRILRIDSHMTAILKILVMILYFKYNNLKEDNPWNNINLSLINDKVSQSSR